MNFSWGYFFNFIYLFIFAEWKKNTFRNVLDWKKAILRVIGKLIQAIKDLVPISSLLSHEAPIVL